MREILASRRVASDRVLRRFAALYEEFDDYKNTSRERRDEIRDEAVDLRRDVAKEYVEFIVAYLRAQGISDPASVFLGSLDMNVSDAITKKYFGGDGPDFLSRFRAIAPRGKAIGIKPLMKSAFDKHFGRGAFERAVAANKSIRSSVKTATRGEPLSVFDVNTAEDFAREIESGVKAPFVRARVSALGGDMRVAVVLTVSLDPRDEWTNRILENSRYARFRIDNDGVISNFSGGGYGFIKRFRKSVVKDAADAVRILNRWVKANQRVATASIASDILKIARDVAAISTLPVGRLVGKGAGSVSVSSDVRVGDIGVLFAIASNVFHVSVPGRKYNYDVDKRYGSGGGAWVKVVKKNDKSYGGGWHGAVVKVVAPYVKGEWKNGGPQKIVELDEEPKEQGEPYYDKNGRPASKGDSTGYFDMNRKPLRLGDLVEVEYTTGRYGQTRKSRGVILGINIYGGITLADLDSIRAWESGKLNFMDQIKSEYIAMHWDSKVGHWEHVDFEHGHKNYVKKIG
jgi:hypothetical protein